MHGDETERGSQASGADAGAGAERRRAAPSAKFGATSWQMQLYYRAHWQYKQPRGEATWVRACGVPVGVGGILARRAFNTLIIAHIDSVATHHSER
jgi:hypothetical protein